MSVFYEFVEVDSFSAAAIGAMAARAELAIGRLSGRAWLRHGNGEGRDEAEGGHAELYAGLKPRRHVPHGRRTYHDPLVAVRAGPSEHEAHLGYPAAHAAHQT